VTGESRRRFFSAKERTALYLGAGGRCESCGEALEGDWHADHAFPHSRGGETDLRNARAVCPGCNLRKGWKVEVLRSGQKDVCEAISRKPVVNAQLPTGYGKTRTAMASYKQLRDRGIVNRCLFVVPTTAQLRQFVQDGLEDYRAVGGEVGHAVVDVAYFEHRALLASQRNQAEFYCCTIQALCANGATWQLVEALTSEHQWLLVVDEYHHYGIDKAWGARIAELRFAARLAMSATPYRGGNDSAFGTPDVVVTYRRAAEDEGAVKPMSCHSYVYKIDFVSEESGEVYSLSTDEVASLGESPDDIDLELIKRRMRWSPKYVSPLVDEPIARMERDRIRTGQPLQAIVYAMSCQHARLVYEQIKEMHPHLRIDWVGTGEYGRPPDENRRVLEKFCPPKENGERPRHKIGLDVLINVAMAGEGLDTRWVSEIIHLTPANISNQTNQKNGRGSRYLEDVKCCVNVDSTSEYAEYTGSDVMEIMDADVSMLPDPSDDSGKEEMDPDDVDLVPDEPNIAIIDMECIQIDMGEVERMGMALASVGAPWTKQEFEKALGDPSHWIHQMAESEYRRMRMREAEKQNDVSVLHQWEQSVASALQSACRLSIAIMRGRKVRYERELAGMVKKRINQRKRGDCGGICKDVDVLKQHYRWLVALQRQIKESGLPAWLRCE